MTEHPLSTFYKGWDSYQHRLVKTIAPLSPEHLASPTASHHRSIGMVAQHMIADRVWCFQLWMGDGSPDLAPIMRWDPGVEAETPVREAAELVAGLESTWKMIAGALARWTGADRSSAGGLGENRSHRAPSQACNSTNYCDWRSRG